MQNEFVIMLLFLQNYSYTVFFLDSSATFSTGSNVTKSTISSLIVVFTLFILYRLEKAIVLVLK